jgi:exodeoxyribonuclease-3
MRHHVPGDQKLFTWWSYRARDWAASNRGRRLDHIWGSEALRGALTSMNVLTEARGWEKPSDHVPVVARFAP